MKRSVRGTDRRENEVGAKTGAGYGETSADRLAQRNGSRDRDWQTRAGNVELRSPKLRTVSDFPSFLEPRRATEKALVAVIQEAYVHGVSTRAMDDLVQAMGGTGVSKSQVSRLCEELDERVDAFLTRPIEGSIRMHSLHWSEFPTVQWTVGAVDGPTSGSTPPTSRSARAAFGAALGPMAGSPSPSPLPSPSPRSSTRTAAARVWE